ncbi:hypothetical protein B0T37_13305 [Chromobacterium violaceum]|uniref:glycosyltransferase family 4 protein n=1 Tax=Chromobacterium violaceum TaxID=536 RepID=UPI0009DAAF15|nr:glycosyltransferase family 4 protein [Chromobacterium violaceum]OQS09708.1 hypothetical protein B0T38_13700 [Chromobacterium violaceum]OQS25570.1 hypothetical protein B0T37_13305 [Chromobacterium violaceum]OQS30467.1 hypothetical protein B0T41_00490 [Chromobacterium violaceum]
MRQRVFGSIDSFVESADSSLKIGRLVGNFGFLQALLRFGEFDQIQLFCPTMGNLQLLRQQLENSLDEDTLNRVVLSHHLNLPDALAATDFDAFHLGDAFFYLPKMAELRARHAAHPFPLTAPTHSLNDVDLGDKIRRLCQAPLSEGDAIFCTSRAGEDVMRHYLALHREPGRPPRTEWVPLGIDESYFIPRARAACRKKLGLPERAFCLLYLGRFSPVTKADLTPLLYALARLRAEPAGPDTPPLEWRLLLAGGGSAGEIASLRQTIGELGLQTCVRLCDNVEDEAKRDLLAAADVFVSPVDNYQETFGLSIVEAMAAGLPVLASDFDGYRDLVVDGETGYLIPTLACPPPALIDALLPVLDANLVSLCCAQGVAVDMECLAQRLRELARSPGLCRALGEAGRRRAQAHFSWRKVMARYDAWWKTLKREALGAGLAKPGAAPQPPLSAFQSYPSRWLAGDVTLQLTPLAEDIVAGKLPMPATYADVSLLSSAPLLVHVLQVVSQLGACGLSEVLEHCPAIAPDYVCYQLAWLLKYGLLRARPLAPAQPAP